MNDASTRWGGRNHDQRGGVLVMALMAVLAVSVLAAGFLQLSSTITGRQGQSVDAKRSFYLAEAGLAEACAGVAVGKSGNVGTSETPALYGDGLFWVEATELDGERVRLESTALVGKGRSSLALVLERGAETVASLGVFALEPLVVPPGTTLDFYDSEEGYPEQEEGGEPAEGGLPMEPPVGPGLGSNGTIAVAATAELPTTIALDVTPGPEHEVVVSGEPEIVGSTEPRFETVTLPEVVVPEVESGAAVDHSDPAPLVLTAGVEGLDALRVRPDAEAVLQGPLTLVVGHLRVDPGGALVLDAREGPVELFVTDLLELLPSAEVFTTVTDPTRVAVQFAGAGPVEGDPGVRLESAGEFHGTIFAPQAKVRVGAAFETFGAIVANELELAPEVRLHFDLRLLELSAASSLPQLLNWRIVAAPAAVSGVVGSDPFDEMGVDPHLLPRPADAHADLQMELTYRDKGGTLRSYDGPESAFDWGNVSRVLVGTRGGRHFAGRKTWGRGSGGSGSANQNSGLMGN